MITIRIWYNNRWREAEVDWVKHDTVVVIEPDTSNGLFWVGREDINPNDLYLVPIPSCRVREHDTWTWRDVITIQHTMIVVQGKDGSAISYFRDDIHPEDNRLMPPPAL